jgi:hypothetical protein
MKFELQQMLTQGGGAMVNTASAAGLVGLVGKAAYVASKHGVVGLTKTAALEYAQHGIRVHCVCPGYIHTPMTAPGMPDPDRLARMIASEPVGRMGHPAEVAAAVVWRCRMPRRVSQGTRWRSMGAMWPNKATWARLSYGRPRPPRRTSHWGRRLPASAPASLWLSGAPDARRSSLYTSLIRRDERSRSA